MRSGPREVAARRQRSLFGVDGIERLCADVAAELVRNSNADKAAAGLDCDLGDSHHMVRIKAWLLEYEEKQGSEWNGVPPTKRNDGKA